MNKLTLIILLSATALTALSSKKETNIAYKKNLFNQNVWSELDSSSVENYTLFYPYNDHHIGWDTKLSVVNPDNVEKHMKTAHKNLWTILFYHIIKNDLIVYSPFDPNWIDHKDNGMLKYPITSKIYGDQGEQNFFKNRALRNFLKEGFLGQTDYSAPLIAIRSIADPSKDSVNSKGQVLYYPRYYEWFTDKTIIKFKIREHFVLDEEGQTLKKEIKAIAPVRAWYDQDGNIGGITEMFWIDYAQLQPLLEDYYTIAKKSSEDQKIYAYDKYFDKGLYNATVTSKDTLHVQLKTK